MTTATGNTCQALNRYGEPCSAAAGEDGYCYFHSPARAVQRLQSASAGGRARHRRVLGPVEAPDPVSVKSTADIVTLLERTINDALLLENSLQRARTIGYLALAACKAHELNELADRVAALELTLKARDGR